MLGYILLPVVNLIMWIINLNIVHEDYPLLSGKLSVLHVHVNIISFVTHKDIVNKQWRKTIPY